VANHFNLNESVEKFVKNILTIQRKVKNQLVTRLSKIEVLINYWDKILGQIQMKASQLKDKKVTALCRQIILVPKEVKF
jgi:hypothetical protein